MGGHFVSIYVVKDEIGDRHHLSRQRMKKNMSLQDKAFAALKKAVRQVVTQHKKTGRLLAVWQNGRVVRISPYTVK
jgi:hypothetical protein